MSEAVSPPDELRKAYAEYERQVAIQNYKVACVLGIVFMPAGFTLDYFVYPEMVPLFLQLRFLCSALLAVVWLMLTTRLGERYYRVLGILEVFLPLLFISGMIFLTKGASSPYYAGLNLVVLGAGIVLRWTLLESVVVLMLALGLYFWATLAHGIPVFWEFYNNLYFLVVTGVFTITGNYFHSRVRLREFTLRFQLDKNQRMLEATNQQLRELDEIKSRFFANISHELRTPLTLMLGPLEALLGRRATLDPQALEWLETIRANGLRLLKLINDLLDLVRLQSGKMELALGVVDLPEFIRGLGLSVRQFAIDKRIDFSVGVGDGIQRVMLDAGKLEKILLNLVFNALKFTPAGGRVSLTLELAEQQLMFEVRDTGMGIAEEQIPFIFDRFWQGDTSSHRKHQGVGIGLAMVKELVDIQNGRVEVSSEVGKGTRFRVFLPFMPSSDATQLELPVDGRESDVARLRAHTLPSPESASWLAQLYRRAELFPVLGALQDSLKPVEVGGVGAMPRILIADDEPDMLRFLRSQLQPHFQVLEAVDGQQAIDKANQFLPDIIVCDMMMPERDGLEVCRELRKRTPTQNIPIVLLTARADEATKIAALEAGASDFLTKPFSLAELHVRLRNLVESYLFQRELSRQKQTLEAALEQLKETETQLVQAEKMASLGRLSAGIIHEVNNPLNFIKTGLFALGKKGSLLPDGQRAAFEELVRDIEDGVNRVRNIVSDLRGFAHPSTSHADEISSTMLIDTALRLLSHEWKDQVRVERDIPADHLVRGNRNQLVQVLLNLIQNSLDAMRRQAYGPGEAPVLRIMAVTDGSRALLRVRDNGVGIPAENMGKIFDPFFTTKDVGEGMGLGLSICYRIIEQHGGRIRVESEPGRWCEFTLELPSGLT